MRYSTGVILQMRDSIEVQCYTSTTREKEREKERSMCIVTCHLKLEHLNSRSNALSW